MKGGDSLYRVLYRKWRPQKFIDVTGQRQVTVTLKQELLTGRIAHAYLFTGSRGTGKTTCAKILAKAINCLQPDDGEPCGRCDICTGIDEGTVTDVVEIDAASNNGVDHIRMLREEAGFTPVLAKYRVYIIDEVHMLSIGAFNALLKTLEEPSSHVVFILATTEAHKIPATILSRCQRFEFRRIASADSVNRLIYIANQEGAQLDEEAALLIAGLADGALRDALSILDQCISADNHVTAEIVCTTVGIVGREYLYQLTQAISKQDSAQVIELIDQLYQHSKDMARLCEELCAHLRNMMLIKTVKDASAMISLPAQEYEMLIKQTLPIPLTVILHGLDTMQKALEKMYRGANPRITFEMAMIQLCSPQLDSNAEALLRRIEALERKADISSLPVLQSVDCDSGVQPEKAEGQLKDTTTVQSVIPSVKEVSTAIKQTVAMQSDLNPAVEQSESLSCHSAEQKQVKETPASVPFSKSQEQQMEENVIVRPQEGGQAYILDQWPEILQILSGYSKTIATAFSNTCAYISGDYVLIDAEADSMAFELLRKSSQREQMREAIRQVTGRVYKLGPYRRIEKVHHNDPLQQLAQQALQAGIDVNIKGKS